MFAILPQPQDTDVFDLSTIIHNFQHFDNGDSSIFLTEAYLGTCQTFMTEFLCENTQSAFTCSKLTIKTLEQGVKYVQI